MMQKKASQGEVFVAEGHAYDIPVFTGVTIPAELTVELAKGRVVAGVKDTSGEEHGFRSIIERTRDIEGFSVINGSDITVDTAMLQGAHGMIIGVANSDPHGLFGSTTLQPREIGTLRAPSRSGSTHCVASPRSPAVELVGSARHSACSRPRKCFAASSITTVSNPRC